MLADATAFLTALSHRSRVAALSVLTGARSSGASVWEVVDRIVAPAQREVGARWQRAEWSVAHEHAATVIAEHAVAAIGVEPVEPVRGHLVAACPQGEWHEAPVAFAAEVLREEGWQVTHLGASVPAHELHRFLAEHRPDALLLGISMLGRLPAAAVAVRAAYSAGVPVVLGGAAVDRYPHVAEAVGAYEGVRSIPDAGVVLREAVRSPLPEPARVPAACRAVMRGRSRLVGETVLAVRRDVPVDLLPEQAALLDSLAAELVDALAAAVLLDDPGGLRDLLGWAAAVHGARDMPHGTERVAAAGLRAAAADLPGRVRALLDEASGVPA